MKIRPIGAELFHADGRTDMTKLIVAFRHFANGPKNERGSSIYPFPTKYFFPFPCHLVPLRPKYSPQHPILKRPQPTFLPQYQLPSFTPIQKQRVI